MKGNSQFVGRTKAETKHSKMFEGSFAQSTHVIVGRPAVSSRKHLSLFEISQVCVAMEYILIQHTVGPVEQSPGGFPLMQQRLGVPCVCEQLSVRLLHSLFELCTNVRMSHDNVTGEMKAHMSGFVCTNLPSGVLVHVFMTETFKRSRKSTNVWSHFFMIASQTVLVIYR